MEIIDAGQPPDPRASETPGLVADLIVSRAAAVDDTSAVVDGGTVLTYEGLLRRSSAAAHWLSRRGIGPGSRVGVLLPRSIGQATMLLAILRAGAAYVPLDPGYPAVRLAAMADIAVDALVVGDDLAQPAWLSPSTPVLRLREIAAARPGSPPDHPAEGTADGTAYVLFTSGSSGTPKGVAMPNRALANLIRWQARHSGAGVGTRSLQFASLNFDVSIQEMLSTWATGGTLVLAEERSRLDPSSLLKQLMEYRIERLFLPFVALDALAREIVRSGRFPQDLRELITAGERLHVTPALRAAFRMMSDCILVNHYGPTETHCVSAHILDGDPACWPALPPIGIPIDGASLHVLDDAGQSVPSGSPGELHVGGVLLADGYVGRDDLTAERFHTHPRYGRLYATGDVVRWHDGVLEFIGRRDNQVKVRGHRAEIGEVEAALYSHGDLDQVAVVPFTVEGVTRLAAFVVVKPAASTTEPRTLRRHLLDRLPEFMVPTKISIVSDLPVTPNGKVDRLALAARSAGDDDADDRDVRAQIVAVWSALLEPPENDDAHFFESGGDSLLAIQLANTIKKKLGVELTIGAVFDAPTLGGLVEAVRAVAAVDAPQPAVTTVQDGQRRRAAIGQEHRLKAREPVPINVLAGFRVRGPLDLDRFDDALELVALRHTALRSRFERDNEIFVEVVDPAPRPRSRRENLAGALADQGWPAVEEWLHERTLERFDLHSAPLWQVSIATLGPDDHLLAFVFEHLIIDGWALGQVMVELADAYRDLDGYARETVSGQRLEPADWGDAQREFADGGQGRRLLDDWRARLGDDLTILGTALPGFIGGSVPGRRAKEETRFLSPEVIGHLREGARKHLVTMYSVAAGALALTVSESLNRDRVVIQTSHMNRNSREEELLVACCSSSFYIPVTVDKTEGFWAVARSAHASVVTSASLARLPAWWVRQGLWPEDVLARHVLPSLYLDLIRPWTAELTFDECHTGSVGIPDSTAGNVGIFMYLIDHGDHMVLQAIYLSDVFVPGAVRQFLDRFVDVLEAGAAEVGQSMAVRA